VQFSNLATKVLLTIWLVGTKIVSHKSQLAAIVNHSMVDDRKNNQVTGIGNFNRPNPHTT
jgi:hypothetical protein